MPLDKPQNVPNSALATPYITVNSDVAELGQTVATFYSGTTAQRPTVNLVIGDQFYNTQLKQLELYTENGWVADSTGPSAVTNITAVATPRIVYGGTPSAFIKFTSATTGAPASTYTVTSTPTTTSVVSTDNTATMTGLTAGTSYTFTVTSSNTYGSANATSAALIACSVPQAPTVGTPTNSGSYVSVPFTANNNGGSAVQLYTVTSNPGNISVNTTSSPVLFTTLTGGTSYTFTVTATNASGTSLPSTASSSITAGAPLGSITNPASSGSALYAAGNRTDGVYYLNPTGSNVFQAYVINSRDGGGWVKAVQWYASTDMSTTASVNPTGTWINAESNLAAGKLRHADITALNTTNSILMKANNTNPSSAHRYWKYRIGAAIEGHFPRSSRLGFVTLNAYTTITTFTTDNCADSGTIPSQGTEYTYDFTTPTVVAGAFIYSTYGSGSRQCNVDILWSDDNTNFTLWETVNQRNNTACGIQTAFPSTAGRDALFMYGGGTGKITYTSTLPSYGTDLDPTSNYTLSLDGNNNGTYTYYCTYSNDTRARCTHNTAGTYQWISDHNYNSVASNFPTGLGVPICWGFYPNYTGTNLHFMSGVPAYQSNGELYWGSSSGSVAGSSFAIYVK
jgi:hypothetical protein